MLDDTNSQYWRDRAMKARATADQMKADRSKRMLRAMADVYDRAAEQIEQQRTWKRRASPGSK